MPDVLTLAAFHEHCKLKNFNRIPRLTFHFVKMLKFKQMLNVWDGSKGVVKHIPAQPAHTQQSTHPFNLDRKAFKLI
jgi:hypothetical protein